MTSITAKVVSCRATALVRIGSSAQMAYAQDIGGTSDPYVAFSARSVSKELT